MNDPIVIVSAARTPIGGLLGDFASLQAHQLGSAAIKAAVDRAGIARDAVDEALMGCCSDGRTGASAGTSSGARRRAAAIGRRGDAVEDVRLRHARDDVCARHAGGRECRRDRCRRHGKHDQRTAPDGQRAQGLSLRRGDDV